MGEGVTSALKTRSPLALFQSPRFIFAGIVRPVVGWGSKDQPCCQIRNAQDLLVPAFPTGIGFLDFLPTALRRPSVSTVANARSCAEGRDSRVEKETRKTPRNERCNTKRRVPFASCVRLLRGICAPGCIHCQYHPCVRGRRALRRRGRAVLAHFLSLLCAWPLQPLCSLARLVDGSATGAVPMERADPWSSVPVPREQEDRRARPAAHHGLGTLARWTLGRVRKASWSISENGTPRNLE